ncbi:MAG: hypothetical protein KKG93_14160, partial [Bacteroidetes bacterium]|nr:hypothetical protein [Bacteroidota bacterium]
TWIPFHPSPDNYQIPGNSRGWNLRSAHLTQFLSGTLLKDIFSKASLEKTKLSACGVIYQKQISRIIW